MLIVSSLAGAPDAFAAYRPARVISLVSEDEAVPVFAGLPPDRHLKPHVERESCAQSIDAAAHERAEEIIRFLKETKGGGDILIHCNRGISRSMAAAFIVLCLEAPVGAERDVAKRLRRAAPFADPCPLLVSYADEILGREGRMIEAIEDLPPPSTVISAPTLRIPTT
jgi:predicted protein tyrosine phosphatase